MYRKARVAWSLAGIVLFAGCQSQDFVADTGHGDLRDWVFGRRHTRRVPHNPPPDSLLGLASEVTRIEDLIRRDGSITVKQPDVWGEANLTHFIQEYDRELAGTVSKFKENVQAYLARSDQAELHSATGIGLAVGEGQTAPDIDASSNLIDLSGDDAESFAILKGALEAVKPTQSGIGLEPTELRRQHSTYLNVLRALRQRNMGSDTTRAAGYALYKFRIPISVIPGRETTRGYSAVTTLRARLRVDEANLRYAFPKMVVADLVDALAPQIWHHWGEEIASDKDLATVRAKQVLELNEQLNQDVAKLSALAEGREPAAVGATTKLADSVTLLGAHLDAVMKQVGGQSLAEQVEEAKKALLEAERDAGKMLSSSDPEVAGAANKMLADLGAMRAILNLRVEEEQQKAGAKAEPSDIELKAAIEPSVPMPIAIDGVPTSVFGASMARLRQITQDYFEKVEGSKRKPKLLEVRKFLSSYFGQLYVALEELELLRVQGPHIVEAAKQVERGDSIAGLRQKVDYREKWLEAAIRQLNDPTASTSWLIAVQAGVADRNIKRILEDLYRQNRISESTFGLSQSDDVWFFCPDHAPEPTLQLWREMIENNFPIHVFALDPQVEEQNVYDAFSRRREMQLALAIGVAQGQLNMDQRLAASRALALEMADIALNRVAVGFSHGNDTFGWYFRPRVQSPPTESTNIGALARTIWSTGPTENYDAKHRQLEPGIRECEVLVVMPSFVNQVDFDITTNWEKLNRPGVTKRSYEEMIDLGRRLQTARQKVQYTGDQLCYRPGDAARLISRLDQLEGMLSLQTHTVNVPYEYEVSAVDLFDRGDVHLSPVLFDYYGLDYVEAGGEDASLFLTGKNFHPTLTHVVIGGRESHSLTEGQVEVISRELLRVKIPQLDQALSLERQFTLRVGTPAGVSNPLVVPAKTPSPSPPPAAKPTGFSVAGHTVWQATFDVAARQFNLQSRPDPYLVLEYEPSTRPLLPDSTGVFLGRLTAKDINGRELLFDNTGGSSFTDTRPPAPLIPVAIPRESPVMHQPVDPVRQAERMALAVPLEDHDQGQERFPGLKTKIMERLRQTPPISGDVDFEITVTLYVKFDEWPVEQVQQPITIQVDAYDPRPGFGTEPLPPPELAPPTPAPPAPATDSEEIVN